MTHFALLKFYGIDWLTMSFQFLAIYSLGMKYRTGFLLGVGGCFFWLLFGIITGSLADITANSLCLGMNVIGWIRWKDQRPTNSNAEQIAACPA